MDFEKSLITAKHLYDQENYQASVRESGTILENALKKLLNEILCGRNLEDKQEILRAEAKIGNGKASINSMTLGQVIGVYRESKAWEIVRKMVKDNCSFIKKIDFDEMCDIRNRAVHSPSDSISAEEAYEDFYLPLRRMLHKFELIGETKAPTSSEITSLEPSVICKVSGCEQVLEKGWKYCPSCGSQTLVICSNCNEELNAKMKICPYCETHVASMSREDQQTNLDELRILVKGALLDNFINKSEKALLESKRIELGITVEEFEELQDKYLSDDVKKYIEHLETIAIDGIVSEEERAYLDQKAVQLKLDPWLVERLETTYLPG